MRMHGLAPLILSVTAAFGQQTELTVGATGSASYVIPPDEAAFDVEVGAARLIESAQVIRAFAELGVKEDNIVRIATSASAAEFAPVLLPSPLPSPQTPPVVWLLQFSVPAAKFKETSDRLDSLSRRLPEPFISINYTGELSYGSKAVGDASAAAVGRLVAQTRAAAEPLARLAGLTSSPVATLFENTREAGFYFVSAGLRTQLLPVITTLSVRFGRTAERSLTTTCSYETALPPDEALFRVEVQAAATTARAQLFEAAAKFGLAESDLTDIRWTVPVSSFTFPPPGQGLPTPVTPLLPTVAYQFELRRPAAQAAEVAARLAELRRAPPAPLVSAAYGFGMNVSDAAVDRAHARAAADSLAACRSRAERIAAAAGVKLGAVRGVSPSPFFGANRGVGVINPALVQSLLVESNLRAPFSITAVFGLD